MGGGGENGGPQFFFDRATWKGGLERSKGALVGGVFLIKVRNFHLPYFGIMFEGGGGGWFLNFFLKNRMGYPKNMNGITFRFRFFFMGSGTGLRMFCHHR